MPVAVDKKLYDQVVKAVKKKVDVWPSAYASGMVVKMYKEKGGRYKGSRKSSNLKRWFDEKWIDVSQLPRIVPCGRSKRKSRKHSRSDYPYCRPLKRVTSRTPKTVKEISKSELKRRVSVKRKNPSKRVSVKRKNPSKRVSSKRVLKR